MKSPMRSGFAMVMCRPAKRFESVGWSASATASEPTPRAVNSGWICTPSCASTIIPPTTRIVPRRTLRVSEAETKVAPALRVVRSTRPVSRFAATKESDKTNSAPATWRAKSSCSLVIGARRAAKIAPPIRNQNGMWRWIAPTIRSSRSVEVRAESCVILRTTTNFAR